MKQSIFLILVLSVLPILGYTQIADPEVYLRKVLSNLENIETATYKVADRNGSAYRLFYEYRNSADTTIGSSYIVFTCESDSSMIMSFGYDGDVRIIIHPEDKVAVVDNFTNSVTPFRLVNPPFHNKAENILKYALDTDDNISMQLVDLGSEYHLRLVINEDSQIEFFGPPHRMPYDPYINDSTSIYELWFKKSDNLPYRISREMAHEKSDFTIYDNLINTLDLEDLTLLDHIPENYTLREYRVRGQERRIMSALPVGDEAPGFGIKGGKGQAEFHDITAPVVLLVFTAMQCGPCQSAVPWLNSLSEKFDKKDLDIIAMESWSSDLSAIKNYVTTKRLAYRYLPGNDELLDSCIVARGVPVYYLIDKRRNIANVFNGFSSGITDREIEKAIEEILDENDADKS